MARKEYNSSTGSYISYTQKKNLGKQDNKGKGKETKPKPQESKTPSIKNWSWEETSCLDFLQQPWQEPYHPKENWILKIQGCEPQNYG